MFPAPTLKAHGEGVITLHPVLTPEECQQLIQRAENHGFHRATIVTAQGQVEKEEVRNNHRVIADDPELATFLWPRIAPSIPRQRLGREVIGLNERFRIYRYHPEEYFDWHSDGSFERPNGERSLLTVLFYLNDAYQGGQTRFEWTAITASTGTALIFGHGLIHQGAPVVEGVKYVLRSDIMYGPVGKFTSATRPA